MYRYCSNLGKSLGNSTSGAGWQDGSEVNVSVGKVESAKPTLRWNERIYSTKSPDHERTSTLHGQRNKNDKRFKSSSSYIHVAGPCIRPLPMQIPFPHFEICGTVTILFTLFSEGAPFSPAPCPEYKLDFCSQHLLSTYYRLHSIHISTGVFLMTQAQPCPPHFAQGD